MKRADAREYMMKTFYQIDFTEGTSKEEALKILERGTVGQQEEYCKKLIDLYFDKLDIVDEKINKYSRRWKTSRMAKPDLAIMRLAAIEVMYMGDIIPVAVAINEAVELAKKYGTDKAAGFINAVLGKISEDASEPESTECLEAEEGSL